MPFSLNRKISFSGCILQYPFLDFTCCSTAIEVVINKRTGNNQTYKQSFLLFYVFYQNNQQMTILIKVKAMSTQVLYVLKIWRFTVRA